MGFLVPALRSVNLLQDGDAVDLHTQTANASSLPAWSRDPGLRRKQVEELLPAVSSLCSNLRSM